MFSGLLVSQPIASTIIGQYRNLRIWQVTNFSLDQNLLAKNFQVSTSKYHLNLFCVNSTNFDLFFLNDYIASLCYKMGAYILHRIVFYTFIFFKKCEFIFFFNFQQLLSAKLARGGDLRRQISSAGSGGEERFLKNVERAILERLKFSFPIIPIPFRDQNILFLQ